MGKKGRLFVISGPAGSGKTTLCGQLEAEFSKVKRVVTTTSRAPRGSEVEGVDYYFLSVEAFRERIEAGAFYEWAEVHGRYYGSERARVLEGLDAGNDLLLNIDVQGAESYRKAAEADSNLAEHLVTIFVQPKNLAQIRERLVGRGTDDLGEIERRLKTAEMEMKEADKFDHVINSGSKEADYAAIRRLYLESDVI